MPGEHLPPEAEAYRKHAAQSYHWQDYAPNDEVLQQEDEKQKWSFWPIWKKTRCYFCIHKEWRLVCSAQISGLFEGADNLILGRRTQVGPWMLPDAEVCVHERWACISEQATRLLSGSCSRCYWVEEESERSPAWAALVCLGKDTQKNLKSTRGKNKFINERTEQTPQGRGLSQERHWP